jgi:diamine N-acetyltransferase
MPENTIAIRTATSADNFLLAELGARTFYDTFADDNTPENMAAYLAASFSPQKQATELADPASLFLIAEIDGLPVGYTRLREGPAPTCITGTHPIEIVRLYATWEMVGRGVGPVLMQACLAEAGRRGCDVVWLDVWEHNPRGRAFYHKWRFGDVGTQTFQLGDELQTDLLMQRKV